MIDDITSQSQTADDEDVSLPLLCQAAKPGGGSLSSSEAVSSKLLVDAGKRLLEL
jgi:hypothetical protein